MKKIGRRCYQVVKCPVKKRKKRAKKKRVAKKVSRASLMQVEPWAPASNKAYISDLYSKVGKNFSSRQEFNRALVEAHKKTPGGLLSRLDLVSAGNPSKTASSHISSHNADYHLISVDAANQLAKRWG